MLTTTSRSMARTPFSLIYWVKAAVLPAEIEHRSFCVETLKEASPIGKNIEHLQDDLDLIEIGRDQALW
jgi:hypothetical protein